MHRSGTSAVAGAARLLGADAPRNMLPPAEDNPLGFWESVHILGVNDWILNEVGGTWYDCIGIDISTLGSARYNTALTFIMLSMMSNFVGARLPLIKDPRLCLLLDLWLPALQALQVSPSVLLVLRDPAEVAASLARRDGLPKALGLAMWLRHMLDAEQATRDLPRHVVSYEALLDDWHGCMVMAAERAVIDWPRGLHRRAQWGVTPVDATLRHNDAKQQSIDCADVPLMFWCEEAFAALRAIERDGSVAKHLDVLTWVRDAFTTWSRNEGRAMAKQHLRDHPIRAVPRFDVPPDWPGIARDIATSGKFQVA
jgi:hypothetical protein